jgi:hypothetical protein
MVHLANTAYKLDVILFIHDVILNTKRSFPFLFFYELVFIKLEVRSAGGFLVFLLNFSFK